MNPEAFLIERYKYVLEQKRTLNEVTFKVVSLFQVIIAAVAAANYEVVKSAQAGTLNLITGRLAIDLLYIFFLISTGACLCLLVGGISSWLKYRTDESEIELAVHGRAKEGVRLRSIFGWYETYVALSMVALAGGYSVVRPTILDQSGLHVGTITANTPVIEHQATKVGRIKS